MWWRKHAKVETEQLSHGGLCQTESFEKQPRFSHSIHFSGFQKMTGKQEKIWWLSVMWKGKFLVDAMGEWKECVEVWERGNSSSNNHKLQPRYDEQHLMWHNMWKCEGNLKQISHSRRKPDWVPKRLNFRPSHQTLSGPRILDRILCKWHESLRDWWFHIFVLWMYVDQNLIGIILLPSCTSEGERVSLSFCEVARSKLIAILDCFACPDSKKNGLILLTHILCPSYSFITVVAVLIKYLVYIYLSATCFASQFTFSGKIYSVKLNI